MAQVMGTSYSVVQPHLEGQSIQEAVSHQGSEFAVAQ
jgi:hypothetical protein